MAVFKFPVLLSENSSGFVTAQCVGEEVTGFGESSAAAIAQVKEYLQWFYADAWWREPEEFGAANLLEIRVEVRPEYKTERRQDENAPASWQKQRQKQKKRVFAATETLPLRVACVYRQEENGSFFATLPLLGIEFYFYEIQTLKQLATAYIQEKLKGATPLDLSRFLPANRVWLEEVSFNLKRRSRQIADANETPTLAQVAEPLGAKTFGRKIQKPFERDSEVDDLVRRLTSERANIILLGETGVGKTTVLTHAVRRIEEDLAAGKISFNNSDENYDDDDEKPPRHRFWQTNGSRLIAGMKYLGQWQERCEEVITELSNIGGVLCAEKLTDFLTGGNPSESLAAFFIPYLQRGELRMIVEANSAELDACRRLLPGFAELFQIVRLAEFSGEKARAVLEKIAAVNARNTQIVLEQNAAGLIYRLFARFLPYQTFPGRTPGFLRQLFEQAAQTKAKEITRENVIELFVKTTGLPELFLRDEITLELKDVVADLERKVIGQPAACQAVANLVTTFKAGLSDPQRPLGVLLFVGQTGVGKTELAKALTGFFFGSGERGAEEERLIRLDMSEYSLPGSSWRLLNGAGGEEPSGLIQKVRQQPFCVCLFDEIEKADAQVFDVLLGLFDEGRLTDRFGRVTNFRSAVVILTSNLGAEKFGSIGFGENTAPSFEREAQAFFRPEFFNRLDTVVRFDALGDESLRQITTKELRSVARREGLERHGIALVWTPETIDFLARQGSDPRYGARPLQRAIETLVTAPLAKFLLENSDLNNCELEMSLNDDKVLFRKIQI